MILKKIIYIKYEVLLWRLFFSGQEFIMVSNCDFIPYITYFRAYRFRRDNLVVDEAQEKSEGGHIHQTESP